MSQGMSNYVSRFQRMKFLFAQLTDFDDFSSYIGYYFIIFFSDDLSNFGWDFAQLFDFLLV
jgi:hypothetical protein